MAQSPDIRVRLTPEGTREVSNAFKKIQQDAERAGRASSQAFDRLRSGAALLARFLPAISFAAIVAGAVRLAREGVTAAAALDDLSESTGASVANLSKLEQQARISGQEMGGIESALIRLNKGLHGTDEESKKATRALDALGLKAADLRKLDTAEALRVIALELNRFRDSGAKSALAADLLGREIGPKLLPYLKDLANDTERASTVTKEQAAASEELGKQFRTLQVDVSNVAQRIALDLVPGVVRYVAQVREAIAITGSLGGALTFLFPTNPFNSTAENIAKVRDELDKLRTQRARSIERSGTFSESLDADIKKAEQRLRFFRFVEAQEIETQRHARSAAFSDTPGESRRFGLGESGQQVLNYASSAQAAGTRVQEAAGRFEDYQARIQAAVAQAIQGSDVVRARELAAQIEALDRLFFESGLDAEVYESALKKLTGTTDNLAEQSRIAAEELRKQQALVDEGKRIFEETRTPAEQLSQTLTRLQTLLDAGVISWDTYGRAVFAAQDAFDATEKKAETAFDDMTQFGIQAARNIQSTMSDALANIGEGSARDMAFNFAKALQKMAADLLAFQINAALFGDFAKTGKLGGLAGAAAAALGFARGGLVRYDGGGMVRGPGTGTSDSIPALINGKKPAAISNGEFIVRAAAVRQPGVQELLHDLNRYGSMAIRAPVRGFADGGLVADGGEGGTMATSFRGDVVIGLDEALIAKRVFSSTDGVRLLTRTIGANKRAIRTALGI